MLERLDKLVLKPVSGSGGYGIVIGPKATDEELAVARAEVAADPRAWTAQEIVSLSTAPTSVGGRLASRHLDLRPFAVNDGHQVWVLPGGLTRVALPEGSLVVNSSQGGGSKDTWVAVAGHRSVPPAGAAPLYESRPAPTARDGAITAVVGSRPDPGPGADDTIQQQQQQQQQMRPC